MTSGVTIIFITIGLFLSTSGQGIILGLILWIFWWLNSVKKNNFKTKMYLIIFAVILFVLIVPLVFQLSIVQKSISRFVNEDGSLGVAATGRLFTYTYYSQLSPLQKIIGVGYGNVPTGVYFNSVAYTLYTNGLLGLLIVIMIFLDAFAHTKQFQRYCCLIYALLILGSASFTAIGIVYYFTFIYSGHKKVGIKKYGRKLHKLYQLSLGEE